MKILIAYEPKSSTTTRLTVEDYAEIFQKIPTPELPRFFQKVRDDLDRFGDGERREALKAYLR